MVTADVHVRVRQSRGARAQALLGVARQAAVHPGRFIPAVAGNSVLLQHVEIVRIALVSRKNYAPDLPVVFGADGHRTRKVRLELRFGLARLQAVVVREGVGGDLLARVGGDGGDQARRIVQWVGGFVLADGLPVRI